MLTSRVFWALLAIASTVTVWRFASGQANLERIGEQREFAFDLEVEIRSAIDEFDLGVFVPRESENLALRDERIGADELALRIDDAPEGRRITVKGEPGTLPSSLSYTARLTLRRIEFQLPASLAWNELGTPTSLDTTELVPTGNPEIVAELVRVFPEVAPEGRAAPEDASAWQRALRGAGIGPIEAVDRLHRRCLHGLRSANFSGRTDALTALRLGEASCGGKTRLMVALARTLGIEARTVGGLILGDTTRKRTSHIWAQLRLGDQWVDFDPLNGHRAARPADYLLLYSGDLPLILYTRGLAFDYGFRAPLERIPSVWALSPESTATFGELPLLRRDQFSLILLAPFALLLTVFLRQVVGVESIGVFLPVLLGFCVTQVGWVLASLLLLLTLVLGVSVRLVLARLHLLHVPRAALLITFLILLFLVLTISLDRIGIAAPRGVLILPLAALAMTVERFTVVALDRGARDAAWLMTQTLFLGALSALVLLQPLFKILTVAFPEVLLVVIAEIAVIGQYRGLRWREHRRFRALGKVPSA